MIRNILILLASAGVLVLSACQSPAPLPRPEVVRTDPVASAWGFDRSDVPRDLEWRYGELANGMRYAIRRNLTPLGSASIRMRVDVGSTAEAEDQQGLAHFLEHMAFNGSTNVPEGEMVRILERNGLAFGADTNASTTFTETVYKLDLPRAGDEVVDTGLMLMRETAGELAIAPRAVDRERGIILSERRARDQYSYRRLTSFLDFALPGTLVARRMPIGDPQVIRSAPAERIRDLYESFYRPDRTVLIVTGDIDPDAIEAKIRARFSDWQPRRPAEAEPVTGTVDADRPTSTAYFRDPAVPTAVSLFVTRPADTSPDSTRKREGAILETLANAMLSRRLAKLARQADPPIIGGSASYTTLFGAAELASIEISAKGDDWQSAVGVADRQLRRALSYGFTQAELDEQMANLRHGFENGARQAATRRSEALADALVSAIDDDLVVTTPAWRLEQFNTFAPRISLDAVNTAFRAIWTGANPQVHVAGKKAIPDAPAAILAAYDESRSTEVLPIADAQRAAFAYRDFGNPGAVATDSRIADLDIRTIRFANNVRLNIKKTDFERDRVRVSLRIGSGALEFNKDKPGLRMFMNSAFASGGLVAHSLDELQTITAGRSVTLGLAASDEYFGTTTITTPEDLELQMQIFAAYMLAPGFRADGDRQWQNRIPVLYDTYDASPGAVAARDVPAIITSGDPRFGTPPLRLLQQRNMAELKAATARAFASGAIEIGIVGDIDEQAAIDIVARTFGALSLRDAAPARLTEARQISFPVDRVPAVLFHEGKSDEAMAMAYWPTTDNADFRTDATLSMLSAVMGLMLTEELRETLGATYSPVAYSSTSSAYPGFGQLVASSNVAVEDIARVEAAVDAIAEKLRTEPVSADLMLRARKPILERIDKSRRENGAWIALLDEAQTEPRWIERFRQARPVYESITAADLQQAAQRWLAQASALRIRILPDPAKVNP
ncbi:M16 family metallopeptidase [Sphingomonas cavernae]|uniref:Insulinase family protein n=1 Tax=Sphingomonas cavernae TaxID=2320861 RepID=A0A418WKT3_9SPHN|nr:M16 family metallopeptidase [Sphingomonas cavernae]RJF90661.1 insulinase family protein [Sphingomonas cavernae]